MEDLKIQWHPAFCSAMELALARYRGHLEYEREYNLNTKPLEVDLLVIKKPADYAVEDEIGRIFREHNLFEYKSPDDKLDIDTFCKVNAYALLYKASSGHVDGIKMGSVSVTLLRDTKPKKLLHGLEREGFTVDNLYKGVYHIGGKAYFSTQIIVSEELEGEQYIWLQALTKKLDRAKVKKLLQQAEKHKSQGDWELAEAVLTVSVEANNSLFNRVKEDADMGEALRKLMADEINEGIRTGEKRGEKIGEKRGEQKEKEKGLKAVVDILKEMHLDFDAAYQKIVQAEPYAGVTRQQVMKYWQ